jgi:hypothetical protein
MRGRVAREPDAAVPDPEYVPLARVSVRARRRVWRLMGVVQGCLGDGRQWESGKFFGDAVLGESMESSFWCFRVGDVGEWVGGDGEDGVGFGEEPGGQGEALEVGTKTDIPVYVVFEDEGCGEVLVHYSIEWLAIGIQDNETADYTVAERSCGFSSFL